MECVPIERPGTESVAMPLALSVDEPTTVAPSLNVTVPVGVPVPDEGVTAAVNRTIWPEVDGFGDEPIDVLVLITPTFTVCVITDEVLVP